MCACMSVRMVCAVDTLKKNSTFSYFHLAEHSMKIKQLIFIPNKDSYSSRIFRLIQTKHTHIKVVANTQPKRDRENIMCGTVCRTIQCVYSCVLCVCMYYILFANKMATGILFVVSHSFNSKSFHICECIYVVIFVICVRLLFRSFTCIERIALSLFGRMRFGSTSSY